MRACELTRHGAGTQWHPCELVSPTAHEEGALDATLARHAFLRFSLAHRPRQRERRRGRQIASPTKEQLMRTQAPWLHGSPRAPLNLFPDSWGAPFSQQVHAHTGAQSSVDEGPVQSLSVSRRQKNATNSKSSLLAGAAMSNTHAVQLAYKRGAHRAKPDGV